MKHVLPTYMAFLAGIITSTAGGAAYTIAGWLGVGLVAASCVGTALFSCARTLEFIRELRDAE